MHSRENLMESGKYDSSYCRVKKWVLIGGIIFFCLAIVAVGLGVYFGTKCSNSNSETTTTTPAMSTTTQPPDLRLPTNLKPLKYVLSVKTYLPSPGNVVTYDPSQNFTFDGNVSVHILCVTDTPVIVMQMSQINITKATLKVVVNDTETDLDFAKDFSYNDDTQEVTFYPKDTLVSGNTYILDLEYIGQLNDDLRGFYRSSYVENEALTWMAVTQFEPTDARRALPCFDEPSFKANFSVSITHPNDMTAISNGMENETIPLADNWVTTRFIDTPEMSTYLLAMCVANFSHVDRTSKKGILFRVWSRPSFIDDAWFAVEMGPQVLDFYADYFTIDFPLVKQDMVALPDFQAGAMENWGMVTYRERDLLVRNGTYGGSNLENTAIAIAHELAHQWFGDLVTLDWWDDIWLNEGFAAFMQYKGVNNMTNHQMHMELQFTPDEIDLAMQSDQLCTSHPLYDPSLVTPDQIFASFDAIAYDKGASVIHMLEQVVGEEVFRDGLIFYLNNHSYANADHEDLWNAIQWSVNTHGKPDGWNGSHLDVPTFMNPLVTIMGFPVIHATRNYTSEHVEFRQQHFVLSSNCTGVNPAYQNATFKWYVPIWVIAQQDPVKSTHFSCWLTPADEFARNDSLYYASNQWLIVNSEMKGYYRVNYDEQNWKMLQKQLIDNHTVIDVRNRGQLLDDALNIARAGLLDYDLALNTTLYLNQELSYIPWASVLSSLTFYNDMFALTADYQYYGQYLETKVSPVYDSLTWNNTIEPPVQVLPHELRQLAVTLMCQIENDDCLVKAQQEFDKFKQACKDSNGTSSCSTVSSDLRRPVYCTGVAQGIAADFNYLYAKYPVEQVAVERDNLLFGLCCSKDPWALTKLLDQAINPSSSFIRQQDSQYVFQYISTNNVGRELLWQYFTSNWEKISQLFSSGFFSLGTIIQAATRSFNSDSQIQDMKDFLQENGKALGTGRATFVQQLEVAESNLVWMQQYAPKVIQWFRDNTPQ